MRTRQAVLAAALLVAAAACAAKVPPPPPAVTAPKFPDYIFPAPPPGLGTPLAIDRHQAGWQYLQLGDVRAAERNFESALKQAGGFYPAEVGLGYTALARNNAKEALAHFDRAIIGSPAYAPGLAGRAEALLATGQIGEAARSIQAALDAAGDDPAFAPLRSRLEVLRFRNQQADIAAARSLAAAGRFDEARTAYQGAIAASPASPFLLRELADVERRAGNPDAALEHARKAMELEPDEARGHVLLGELYEARGEFAKAVESLSTAMTLQPDDAVRGKLEVLRARAAFEAMPAEYREIETSPTVTRAQLAALLAVRLEAILAQARSVGAVVITDTRGNWASPYILGVARTGVMEVYPNHTFQPDEVVRRGDLARAVSEVLEHIAARNPQLAAGWRAARRKLTDVGPGHLDYTAASLAVEAGVMSTLDDGRFELMRPVTGAEAVAAVTRLQELGDQPAR